MKAVSLLIALASLSLNIKAQQPLDSVFALVERNNVSLRTYQARAEATKQESRMSLALADPEAEFNYLWGTPEGIGNRRDISVAQPLDFATLLGTRRREAKSRQQLADIELEQARNLVCLAAQELVINLTYMNKTIDEFTKRLDTARTVEQAFEKMLAAGEVSRIEASEARLATVEAEAELQKMQAERRAALVRLKAMGADINYTSRHYPSVYLKGNKSVEISNKEAAVAEQAVSVAKAEGLPEVKAGYMAELTRDEKFRGITLGLSIPLWNNRANLRHAKAERALAQAEAHEQAHNIEAQRTELREKAEAMSALYQKLETALARLDTTPLLGKTLQAGEISRMDYITSRQRLYDLQDQLLELERDHQLAISQLMFIE